MGFIRSLHKMTRLGVVPRGIRFDGLKLSFGGGFSYEI
jgi:hypothetical protein